MSSRLVVAAEPADVVIFDGSPGSGQSRPGPRISAGRSRN